MSDLPESLNRARAAAFSDRPAWEALQNQRPPRPMPRQMRPPEQRSRDPRLAPMERQRALNQFERGNAANADTYQRQAFDQRNQVAEAGAMAVESTGLPAIRRAGSDLARWGAYSAGTEQGGEDLASGLMNAGAGGLGVLGMAGLAPRSRGALRAPQQAPEPMPRLTPPPRQIAPNGMPIRPPQPFRQSMVGGSDDLAEAAGRGGQAPDVGNAGAGRVAYRGLNRPYDPNNGGYYQAFTSSLDDAREYGPNVMAANLQLGRNLAIDGGGNNFNALSVAQLPADVRARLHPSIGASATTDQIAHAAREAGYDSVTVRNVHDNRWGERPARGAEPRTIDFVFDTRNISPLDSVPEQAAAPRAPEGRVRLSDADRALLDELERDINAPARGDGPARPQANTGGQSPDVGNAGPEIDALEGPFFHGTSDHGFEVPSPRNQSGGTPAIYLAENERFARQFADIEGEGTGRVLQFSLRRDDIARMDNPEHFERVAQALSQRLGWEMDVARQQLRQRVQDGRLDWAYRQGNQAVRDAGFPAVALNDAYGERSIAVYNKDSLLRPNENADMVRPQK